MGVKPKKRVLRITFRSSEYGTTVTAQDIVIQNTQIQARAEAGFIPACERGFGDGILVLGGVDITLRSFASTSNARVGMHLFDATGPAYTRRRVMV